MGLGPLSSFPSGPTLYKRYPLGQNIRSRSLRKGCSDDSLGGRCYFTDFDARFPRPKLSSHIISQGGKRVKTTERWLTPGSSVCFRQACKTVRIAPSGRPFPGGGLWRSASRRPGARSEAPRHPHTFRGSPRVDDALLVPPSWSGLPAGLSFPARIEPCSRTN